MRYVLVLLLCSGLTYADGIVTDVGLGQYGSKGSGLSQDKFAKLGLQEEIWNSVEKVTLARL